MVGLCSVMALRLLKHFKVVKWIETMSELVRVVLHIMRLMVCIERMVMAIHIVTMAKREVVIMVIKVWHQRVLPSEFVIEVQRMLPFVGRMVVVVSTGMASMGQMRLVAIGTRHRVLCLKEACGHWGASACAPAPERHQHFLNGMVTGLIGECTTCS